MDQFERVLQQYEPMISATMRQLNIYRDFEQFQQAGRVALWQAWTRYDQEKGHFAPYAARSIRGGMLDLLKVENKFETHYVQTEDDLLTFMAGVESDDIFDNCWSEQVLIAIDQLNDNEKQLIQWLYVEQLSQAECAKLANISVSGIKKRRERMIAKLRKLLEK